MRRYLIAGNWKMNTLLETGTALASGLGSMSPSLHPGKCNGNIRMPTLWMKATNALTMCGPHSVASIIHSTKV